MPLNTLPDSEVLAKSAAMAVAFTPDRYAYLLSLLPTPEGYAALHNSLEGNYTGLLKGDPDKTKAFEADRQAVNVDLSLILGLAKIVAVKDPTVPASLGVDPPDKKAAPAANLDAPHGFIVYFDPKGNLFFSVTKVDLAKGYQVWGCDSEPSVESNWRLITSSSNCKKIPLTGVDRAKFNVFRIRAIRGKVTSPWSNWVSLEPTK